MPLPLRTPLPSDAVPVVQAVAPHISEDFLWVAVYKDGAYLPEYAIGPLNNLIHHPFADIDQHRLASFILLPLRDHLTPVAIEPQEGKRLIFFRRRAGILYATGEVQQPKH